MKRAAKFKRLAYEEKKLFVEAVLFLYAAKMMLSLLPFKHCLWLLRGNRATTNGSQTAQLEQFKKAIQRSRWCLHWDNECLTMSVASRWMLQRRGIPSRLSLGVGFDEGKKLKAHAWLGAEEMEVVERGEDFWEIYSI